MRESPDSCIVCKGAKVVSRSGTAAFRGAKPVPVMMPCPECRPGEVVEFRLFGRNPEKEPEDGD